MIVPDKFKGTLTAAQAASAIARGWRSVRPGDELELLPMSDGGDGFGEVLSAKLGARLRRVPTVDAAHRPCRAAWWWEPESGTAIIESANVIGLAKLPGGRFHPGELDTFGLGALVRAAADRGARRCLVGVGGSATNDGGFGLARSLGWEFLDDARRPIERWMELDRLEALRRPENVPRFESLIVAVDVQNPLLGPRGCSRVYGPQKGLKEFGPAERALGRLARVVWRDTGKDYARKPGAGAAGGLGFGFACFLGARLEPGFDLFARLAGLDERLARAGLVLTGEGAIDRQTLMGKGVGQIARLCRAREIPCVALAGTVPAVHANSLFTRAMGLLELTTYEDAKARAGFWLGKLAARAARAARAFEEDPNTKMSEF